jgi:hypothetical protein
MNKAGGGCNKFSNRNNMKLSLKLSSAPISCRKWEPHRVANTLTKTVVLADNHLYAQFQRYAHFLEMFGSVFKISKIT